MGDRASGFESHARVRTKGHNVVVVSLTNTYSLAMNIQATA